MSSYQLDKALNEIFAFIDRCNEYVQDKQPWISKDKKVLFELKESILEIAKLLWAFIPETSEKITKIFSAKKIKKSAPLFEKLEYKEEKKETKKEKIQKDKKSSKKVEGVVNMSDMINFNEFSKVDLRVGTIKKVEEIEGADKLYKLTVEIGKEKRTICAGIKEYYKADELKGKQIIVVVNLEPRKMRGIESQGMLLAASDDEHKKVVLIGPEKKVDSGYRVG